jgi:hypothetical protein
MIYMAVRPTHGTDIFVGDRDELAKVRWVTLAEADQADAAPRHVRPRTRASGNDAALGAQGG